MQVQDVSWETITAKHLLNQLWDLGASVINFLINWKLSSALLKDLSFPAAVLSWWQRCSSPPDVMRSCWILDNSFLASATRWERSEKYSLFNFLSSFFSFRGLLHNWNIGEPSTCSAHMRSTQKHVPSKKKKIWSERGSLALIIKPGSDDHGRSRKGKNHGKERSRR